MGVKSDALCWQESFTSANAQCTVDCVNVTKTDGSVFYPVVRRPLQRASVPFAG